MRRLAARAALHHDVVDREEAHAAGFDDHAIRRRVASGYLFPVFAGTWSVGHPAHTARARMYAAVKSVGGSTRLSGIAAAVHLGLLKGEPRVIDVTTTRHPRPRPGVRVTRVASPPDGFVHDDIPVVTVEQAILDCATSIRRDTTYLRIVKNALVEELTSYERLVDFAASSRGRRGVSRLRKVLDLGPERTRSRNEDEALAWLRSVGLEPQVNVDTETGERDIWLPGHDTYVEIDGRVHDNPLARRDDARKSDEIEATGKRLIRIRAAR